MMKLMKGMKLKMSYFFMSAQIRKQEYVYYCILQLTSHLYIVDDRTRLKWQYISIYQSVYLVMLLFYKSLTTWTASCKGVRRQSPPSQLASTEGWLRRHSTPSSHLSLNNKYYYQTLLSNW